MQLTSNHDDEASNIHEGARQLSYGEQSPPTIVDRFGVWLSARQIRRCVPHFSNQAVGDFGCGYHASFVRSILGELDRAIVIDVSLAPDLKRHPKIVALEGVLPNALPQIPDSSLDTVLCVSVLEHLWDPIVAVREFRRMLRPEGTCLLNVPSWRGKWFLEFSAFRLGLSPASEMNDHKMYYNPKDLWPLLVEAGFLPQDIKCFSHKFGLNTFAVCRKRASS